MRTFAMYRPLLSFALVWLTSQAMAEHPTIGTIEAEVDGTPYTWHMIANDNDALHSALAMTLQDKTQVTLGGYESLDVVFDRGVPPSASGPGSAIVISFQVPDSGSGELMIGEDIRASVIIMPKVGDFSSMRSMMEGTVTVTDSDLSDVGAGDVNGTFSGRLVGLTDPEREVELTNGRFRTSGIRGISR